MGALQELQLNDQDLGPRSPRKQRDDATANDRGRSQSPIKSSRFFHNRTKSREVSPAKPKKTKSGTNLAGLLSRPKSLRNLYKLATDEAQKENKSPQEPQSAGPPPIYAQFASDNSLRHERSSIDAVRSPPMAPPMRPAIKDRPKSYQVPVSKNSSSASLAIKTSLDKETRTSSEKPGKSQRGRVLNAFNFGHKRTQSETSTATELLLDPKDIDKNLEAMLDRRNIPENQRYKMRNLNDTIKMEFIRQDWAEMQATKERPGTNDSMDDAVGSDVDDDKEKLKRTRGRSFTFSRGKKDTGTKKSKGDGTLGRHLRSRSTDSIASERPGSSHSTGGSTILSKIKLHQGPSDYVSYLRKVQKPELVEVGKLHKLRLLLRNETVAWIEEFIQLGGMKDIVGLLNRILEVEWR